MNTEHYTYLLANPQKINSKDVADLDHLLQKYPYFQSARALQLKGLKSQESYRYNDALKLTAAHTTDRDILFEYITSEKFIQNEISQTILQQESSPSILDIEVISEDVSEQVSLEIKEETNFKAEKQKAEAILNPDLFQRKVESVANLIEPEESVKPEESETTGLREEKALLDTNKPLDFTKSDTHSFSEWLKLTKAKPIDHKQEQPEEAQLSVSEDITLETSSEERERKFDLIDKFIQERPKIIPDPLTPSSSDKSQKHKSGNEQKNILMPYTQAPDSLMTETLAKVYLQQKNYKKAIQAYKILILKNPEKSGFFADQIRAIEKSINTET